MGEASFELQLTFQTSALAEASELAVKDHVELICEVYDTWQAGRWAARSLAEFAKQVLAGRFTAPLTIMGLRDKVLADPSNGLAYTYSMSASGMQSSRSGPVIQFWNEGSHHGSWDYVSRYFEAQAAEFPGLVSVTDSMRDYCCDY